MPKSAKNNGRGVNFSGQQELHRSSSPAETPGGCSSAIDLSLRATRVDLRQRNDGENRGGRHDLCTSGNEREGERKRGTRGPRREREMVAIDWSREPF